MQLNTNHILKLTCTFAKIHSCRHSHGRTNTRLTSKHIEAQNILKDAQTQQNTHADIITHKYTYIYLHIHTHTNEQIQIQTGFGRRTPTKTLPCICTYLCMYVCPCVFKGDCMSMFIHVYVHVFYRYGVYTRGMYVEVYVCFWMIVRIFIYYMIHIWLYICICIIYTFLHI